MSTKGCALERLRKWNRAVEVNAPSPEDVESELVEESLVQLTDEGRDVAFETESIILRKRRPVFAIKNGTCELKFIDREDRDLWRPVLSKARKRLNRAISAIGRIQLENHDLEWVGTGWLVDDDIIVTNRHVANEFAHRNGDSFTFRSGPLGRMRSSIDLLREIGNEETAEFAIKAVLQIVPEPGPDVAFLRVEPINRKEVARIELADAPKEKTTVAVIGYPAADSRIPDQALMRRIYQDMFNLKRLAPGSITKVERDVLLHNCTTLGGNSGSAVIDVQTGKSLGLHYSGRFLDTNYAVRSDVLRRLMHEGKASGWRLRRESTSVSVPSDRSMTVPLRRDEVQVTVPVTITVSLAGTRATGGSAASARDRWDLAAGTYDGNTQPEARKSDYKDRAGYDPTFLDDDAVVPLPGIVREIEDVVTFDDDGGTGKHELTYQHFSVVMSHERRMCFFSAVNIDGSVSRKGTTRGRWRRDPRIPHERQILDECYGNPPKFSRGHMTRREDPAWGDTAAANRGNDDSMHVTNAAPQMQAFNSPIWLDLEDYALSHARKDKMRISVFTGPYFEDDDPRQYGVRIPRYFWKIIAFVHDETGELCATGYEMSQESTLDEFVFGAHRSPQLNITTQIPIHAIELRTGIDFGPLAACDPLLNVTEGIGQDEVVANELMSVEQIRFR